MINYIEQNDQDLIEMAQSGDRLAEDAISQRYRSIVTKSVRSLYLVGGSTDDLIQEGMLGLLSAIRNFKPDGEASFKSFATVCIKRKIYSAIRNANKAKYLPLNSGISLEHLLSDETQTPRSTEILAYQQSPEEQVLASERRAELFNFVDCLSDLEKKVIVYYLEGYSYDEIADIIGKNTKSVDNAMQRIRRKLARSV